MSNTSLVHIEPGQWVLAYKPEFGPCPGRNTLQDAIERLQYGGSGWVFLDHPSQQFDIVQADLVKPKTVLTSDRIRIHRDQIVASANSANEMEALRDKLFSIGKAADKLIREETERRMAEFCAKTRADALAKVRATLPHIFGRQA